MKTIVHKLKDRSTLIAALTYFVFFLPRFTEHKADPEMHYHMKQALGILVAYLSIRGLLATLYYLGMPSGFVILLKLAALLYIVLGIKNVLEGKMQPLPFIGKYAERVF